MDNPPPTDRVPRPAFCGVLKRERIDARMDKAWREHECRLPPDHAGPHRCASMAPDPDNECHYTWESTTHRRTKDV